MSLKRITLHLARNPGFPNGDDRQGYTLIAPLGAGGALDEKVWAEQKAHCRVFRFHPDPSERADGWLRRRGKAWYFHYDEEGEGDDESGFKLGSHAFVEGEYVTVARHGSEPLTYRITDVSIAA
jgi:hypothetical protein